MPKNPPFEFTLLPTELQFEILKNTSPNEGLKLGKVSTTFSGYLPALFKFWCQKQFFANAPDLYPTQHPSPQTLYENFHSLSPKQINLMNSVLGQTFRLPNLKPAEQREVIQIVAENLFFPELFIKYPEYWKKMSGAEKRKCFLHATQCGFNTLLQHIFALKDPEITYHTSLIAVVRAAEVGNLDTLKLIIADLGDTLTLHIQHRILELAVSQGHVAIIEYMLPTTSIQAPTLMAAAQKGNLAIIALLLDAPRKADSSLRAQTLQKAIEEAEKYQHADAAALFRDSLFIGNPKTQRKSQKRNLPPQPAQLPPPKRTQLVVTSFSNNNKTQKQLCEQFEAATALLSLNKENNHLLTNVPSPALLPQLKLITSSAGLIPLTPAPIAPQAEALRMGKTFQIMRRI